MKKIILLLIFIISLFIFSGCGRTVIDESGIEHKVLYGFLLINKFHNDNCSYVCYDPTTKICYIIIINNHRAAISPYYVINDNGEPELAIYQKNYKR